MEKMVRCPFCKNKNPEVNSWKDRGKIIGTFYAEVFCPYCHCTGPLSFGDTKEGAISNAIGQWNNSSEK